MGVVRVDKPIEDATCARDDKRYADHNPDDPDDRQGLSRVCLTRWVCIF